MPISVCAPRGVFTASGECEVLPRLTRAVLDINGAVGNAFLTSIVGGHVELHDPSQVYAGGGNRPVVMIRFDTPHPAFNTAETRRAFIEAATRIVDECTVPWHERENTWVNIFNAPDGAWGIGGIAYTDEALLAAITAAGEAAADR